MRYRTDSKVLRFCENQKLSAVSLQGLALRLC